MFDLVRFRSGDPAYFGEILRDYTPTILVVCQPYATDIDHAEDLVQETWARVVAEADSLRAGTSVKGWLELLARRVCVSDRKVRMKGREMVGLYANEQFSTGVWDLKDPLALTEEDEQSHAIHAAIARLTDRQQQAVVLRVLEGRSTHEVSAIMGVDPSTVRSHVHHATKRLREIVDVVSPSPPKELRAAVTEISTTLMARLAKDPTSIHIMRPRLFEELIAEILASYGWEVQITPATRDGGYDLFGVTRDAAGLTSSWIVECKKYRRDRKVGVDIVRSVYGLKTELRGVGNALLAITSDFSRDAHSYKASRYDLELRDYEGVLEWINEYRPNADGGLYLKDSELTLPD